MGARMEGQSAAAASEAAVGVASEVARVVTSCRAHESGSASGWMHESRSGGAMGGQAHVVWQSSDVARIDAVCAVVCRKPGSVMMPVTLSWMLGRLSMNAFNEGASPSECGR